MKAWFDSPPPPPHPIHSFIWKTVAFQSLELATGNLATMAATDNRKTPFKTHVPFPTKEAPKHIYVNYQSPELIHI